MEVLLPLSTGIPDGLRGVDVIVRGGG